MQKRGQQSLADTLLVWGFVASFVGLLGAGCFEAYKIVAAIPAVFESAPAIWRNPMRASDYDEQPNQAGRSMTSRERERARQQER
jgi:hypothetical protein